MLGLLFGRSLASLALCLCGCIRTPTFHCASATDCATQGATCQPVGYCSFPDSSCADGQRFGELSGPFANQCVGQGAGDAGVDGPADARVFNDALPSFAVRVNIAGPAYTGVDHPGAWTTDPGVGGICNGAQFDSPTMTLNSTNDSALYRNQMYGATLTCAVPNIPSGTYQVTLLFAELRLGGAPCTGGAGDRIFDVSLEGTTVLTAFDLTTAGGGCAAMGGSGHPIDKVYTVPITDGTLNLSATASMGAAALNAIEIIRP